MSAIKRELEDRVYSMKYNELYTLLKKCGWNDKDIKDMYDTYHNKSAIET